MSNVVLNFGGDTSELSRVVDVMEELIAKEGEVGRLWAATSAKMKAADEQTTTGRKTLGQTIKETNDNLKQMDKIIIGAQARKAYQDLQKEVSNLKTMVVDLTKQLDNSNKTTQETGTAALSARARLRAMREELVLLASQGRQNTARFRELQNEAGELADTMADVQSTIAATGSDTRNLSGLISIAQGVAGGFAVAAGATALFGSENENLNEVLKKVQGVMAIVQGLQEIQNILQKESAANIFLSTVARRAETVATEEGTVAQEGLNRAMKLNPAGVVIAAILALVVAYEAFADSAEESVESSKEFREEIGNTSKNAFEAQNKLEVLKLRVQQAGNSFTEKKAILKDYNKEFGDTIGKANSINELEKILVDRAPAYIQMLGLKAKAQAAANLVQKEQEKQLEKQLETEQYQKEFRERLGNEKDDLTAAGLVEINIRGRRIIEAKYAESNARIDKLNQLQVDAEKQAADIAKEFHLKTEDDKTNKTKKETDNRQKLAEAAAKKALEIQDAADAELKKLRDENYLAEFVNDVQRAREKAVLDFKNEKERIEGLKISKKTRADLLEALRQKEYNELAAIDKKAAAEEAKAALEVANGRAAALEKAQKEALDTLERLKAEDDAKKKKKADDNKKLLDVRLAAIKDSLSFLQQGLGDVLGDSAISRLISGIDSIGFAAADVFERIKAGSITTIEGIQELAKQGLQVSLQVANQLFAEQQAIRQADLQERIATIEAAKNQELAAENLTAQQRSDIQARYDLKEKAAKTKAFEDDKKAKEVQAAINGALAITNIFATVPKFDFGVQTFILAGIAAATTLAQVSFIRGQKPPRFRHGKVGIEGPGTTTSDSIHAMISRGESVINAEATAKHTDLLEAVNSDRLEEYYARLPQMAPIPAATIERIRQNGNAGGFGGAAFDMEKFAELVATKMVNQLAPKIPPSKTVNVNIDKNGIRLLVQEANSLTEFQNKRYSTRD